MKRLQDHKADEVRCRLVGTLLALGVSMVTRVLVAIASLHVDGNEAHEWATGCCDVSVAFSHTKIDELVYMFTRHEALAYLGLAGSSTEL